MKAIKNYREVLQERLSERLSGNPHYSLRAFARDIGLSPAQLSSVLNGKRGISPKKAREVFGAAKLDSDDLKVAILQVEMEHARSPKVKQRAAAELKNQATEASVVQLTDDAFKVISDWSHFAILQVIALKTYREKSFSIDPTVWIAKKLGIQTVQTKLALERLLRLELVTFAQNGLYTVCQDTVLSPSGVPSSALKLFHKQVIQKALTAVDAQSVDERFYNNSMFPVLKSAVPEISKEISRFRKKLLNKYGRVSQRDGEAVYVLSQLFFRLTEE